MLGTDTEPRKPKKPGKKKPANQKSFTIPFDVAVLILGGILIFIMFLLAHRSCTTKDEQIEKMKINFESVILNSQEEELIYERFRRFNRSN